MKKEELLITARQALLEMNEEETEFLASECTRMLEYMKQMDQADVENLEPTTHALSSEVKLREDEPAEDLQLRQSLLQRAKQREGTSFKIPKVLP